MTPQEKAEELVNKFLIETENRTYCGLYRTVAIKCALIAVDEILKAAFYSTDEIYNFYIEVKQEIINI